MIFANNKIDIINNIWGILWDYETEKNKKEKRKKTINALKNKIKESLGDLEKIIFDINEYLKKFGV